MELTFDQWLNVFGLLGAIGSFAFGVVQWKAKSDRELAQAEAESKRLAETRYIEATRPFLERQLKLYTEACQVAAVVSTSKVPDVLTAATQRFWELYWGDLAMVENPEVERAMENLGDSMRRGVSQSDLEQLSLQLAHACRASLDRSWGIRAWSLPDAAADDSAGGPPRSMK